MAKIGAIFLLMYITRTLSNPVMTRENLLKQANKTEMCSKLITFNGAYYTMEEVQRLNGIPADLNVHWKTGNIYFTLINEAMKMNLQVIRPSGEVETVKVAGVGQSTCVDNLNDIIYLGTDNGVYTYTDDGHTELYTALGEDVMYIAVSHEGSVMYIATWPQNRVQKVTMDGQKQETFQDIPNGHGLTADTRNNLYFVATKTTYVLKNGQNIPVNIMGLPKDKMTGVYVSRSDDVFAMDENSNFYEIDGENAQAKYLGTFNVKGVNTFALDSSDNILIGVNGRILKFVTHESNPCSDIPNNRVGKRHSKKYKKRTTTTTTPEAEDDYE